MVCYENKSKATTQGKTATKMYQKKEFYLKYRKKSQSLLLRKQNTIKNDKMCT